MEVLLSIQKFHTMALAVAKFLPIYATIIIIPP